jgi:Co/Zn/Cd efflux system component
MGVIGILALAANLASVLLLLPYKDGDANVRSVWLCSRNDAIGNIIVMFAALGVWGTATAWPDLAVAAAMAGIFLTSSAQILRQAWAEYRTELRHAEPEASSRYKCRKWFFAAKRSGFASLPTNREMSKTAAWQAENPHEGVM